MFSTMNKCSHIFISKTHVLLSLYKVLVHVVYICTMCAAFEGCMGANLQLVPRGRYGCFLQRTNVVIYSFQKFITHEIISQ